MDANTRNWITYQITRMIENELLKGAKKTIIESGSPSITIKAYWVIDMIRIDISGLGDKI